MSEILAEQYVEQVKDNIIIADSFVKAESVLSAHARPWASVSGGADSDIVMDICAKLDPEHRVQYVWFDTGLEYQATKDHLKYLQEKYGVKIHRGKPVKPIPLCCHDYGQPFLNKIVSEILEQLQRHNFQWEDESYETLMARYPKCKSGIKWWTNQYEGRSRFNSNHNSFLKEFLIESPPWFKISAKCCKYAKKEVAKSWNKEHDVDVEINGIRHSEGGGSFYRLRQLLRCG